MAVEGGGFTYVRRRVSRMPHLRHTISVSDRSSTSAAAIASALALSTSTSAAPSLSTCSWPWPSCAAARRRTSRTAMVTRTTVVFADRRDRATRMTPSQHAKRTVGTLHALRLHYTHSNGDVHFETCSAVSRSASSLTGRILLPWRSESASRSSLTRILRSHKLPPRSVYFW